MDPEREYNPSVTNNNDTVIDKDLVIGYDNQPNVGNGIRISWHSSCNPKKVFKEGTADWYNLDKVGFHEQEQHYNGVGTSQSYNFVVKNSLTKAN